MPRSGASGSGSGPRRPQELVVCRDVSTGIAGRPADGLGQAGAVGHEEEHQDAALERQVPQPDRTRPRPQAIGSALVVGLEDLRGQQQRHVVIAPAQQAVLRVEPGIAHQPLHRRIRLGEDLVEPRRDFLDRRARRYRFQAASISAGASAGQATCRTACRASDAAVADAVATPGRDPQDRRDKQAGRQDDHPLEPARSNCRVLSANGRVRWRSGTGASSEDSHGSECVLMMATAPPAGS